MHWPSHGLLRERDLVAELAGPELEIGLLLAHRESLVGQRRRMQCRLRWHLHELAPDFRVPAGALDRPYQLDRCSRVLAALDLDMRVRIARELVGHLGELTSRIRQIERELAELVAVHAAPLLEVPGCGVLTAAKLLAEVAGIHRFATPAKLAMHAGVAPLPASSGTRQRFRLNRSGNRQLNCALHRIAVTQARIYPPAQDYLARKEANGQSRREALRCLKRHLANVVFRVMRAMSLGHTSLSTPLE